MPIAVSVIAMALMFVLLSGITNFKGIDDSAYERAAIETARSNYRATGTIPSTVTVYGRSIPSSVYADRIVADPLNYVNESRTRLRDKRNFIEQAAINTCIMLQNYCHTSQTDLLWAFLPNTEGRVQELFDSTKKSWINCVNASQEDYAEYGRHIFTSAISEADIALVEVRNADASNGLLNHYDYYYKRPSSPSIGGCNFIDIIEMK